MSISAISTGRFHKTGLITLALAGVLALGACESSGPRERTGTVVGGVGGALVGGAIGGWTGAIIGGLGGVIVGNVIGRDMDEAHRDHVRRATYQSAVDGRRVDYENGYAQPIGPHYMRNGRQCRDFEQVVTRNGQTYRDQVTLCRNPDGSLSSM